MNIALIGPDLRFKGGIGQYNHFLALEVLRQGHNLLFVGFERQYPSFLYPPGTGDMVCAENTVTAYTVERLLSWDRPLSWMSAAKRIRAFSPDVVVLPWWTFFWYPWFAPLLARLAPIPRVIIAHNAADHEQHGIRGCLSRWTSPRIFQYADRIIVQSSAEKERVLHMGGNDIVVVHHPVYPHFSSSVPRHEARKRFGIPLETTVVLFFGTVRPYKGADLFADALVSLPRDIVGIIAGEIWDKKLGAYLRQKAREASNLLLLDRYFTHEEGSLLFAAADVVVLPYRTVTGSGAAMAALGAGKPLIVSDLPLFREIFPPGSVTFFPAEDSAALAGVILEHFLSPNKLQSDEARNMIFQHFGWDRLVNAVSAVVKKSDGIS